jgi:hypothetical protein
MLALLQVREIWLSSEDTGAYGRDLGSSLPALLRALLEVLPPGAPPALRPAKAGYGWLAWPRCLGSRRWLGSGTFNLGLVLPSVCQMGAACCAWA